MSFDYNPDNIETNSNIYITDTDSSSSNYSYIKCNTNYLNYNIQENKN